MGMAMARMSLAVVAAIAGCDRVLGLDPVPDGPVDPALRETTFIKSPISEAGDDFGVRVALSGDGTTLAVAAIDEDSSIGGVNPADDNLAPDSGAVYIYTRREASWMFEATLKATMPTPAASFGRALALSHTGDVLVVGTPGEGSEAGAVYTFERTLDGWHEASPLRSPTPVAGELFGFWASLSADGGVLAASAPGNDARGDSAGRVYLYARVDGAWVPRDMVESAESVAGDRFGEVSALSDAGDLLVVGAQRQAESTGAAYVFALSSEGPRPLQVLHASNLAPQQNFGSSVAVSADGSIIAIAAHTESGGQAGIDPTTPVAPADSSGAVYLFERASAEAWQQAHYIKAPNVDAGDRFGPQLQLSRAGDALVVGSFQEASGAGGIDGDMFDNSTYQAGAAYLYLRDGAQWHLAHYVKPHTPHRMDLFGGASAITDDGKTLAIAAQWDDSSGRGVGADVGDEGAVRSGAVYVFELE